MGNSPVTGEFPHKGSATRKMFPFDDVIMSFGAKYVTYLEICTGFVNCILVVWCRTILPISRRFTSLSPGLSDDCPCKVRLPLFPWNRLTNKANSHAWWRHQMETLSALLALCAGNSPVTSEFPSQRPMPRSFDVPFDLRLNNGWSQQSRRRWLDTPSSSLWRHCNGVFFVTIISYVFAKWHAMQPQNYAHV